MKERNKCVTESVRLIGSDGWSRNMFIGLIQRVSIYHDLCNPLSNHFLQYGLQTDVAKHLSNNYGDRAWTVCALAEPTGESWPLHGIRLSPSYPCKL